jgi:hypothetical protein
VYCTRVQSRRGCINDFNGHGDHSTTVAARRQLGTGVRLADGDRRYTSHVRHESTVYVSTVCMGCRVGKVVVNASRTPTHRALRSPMRPVLTHCSRCARECPHLQKHYRLQKIIIRFTQHRLKSSQNRHRIRTISVLYRVVVCRNMPLKYVLMKTN